MNTEEILAAVARYHKLSVRRVHMIPSENSMSLTARLPFMTDMIHRYCFTAKGENLAWPGNAELDAIEENVNTQLRSLFKAQYVNVKPISGLNCMAVVMSALAEPAATVFSIGLADGGHGSTRFLAERMGLTSIDIPYDRSRFSIHFERLASLARPLAGPKLIYLDQFMCLFPHDLAALRAAVGPDAIIHYDGSHTLGLIAGGQFQDPLVEGADSLAGSTHKSFPGPHKGIVLTNSKWIADRIDRHAAYWVSHHHFADVAALAITLAEFRQDAGSYALRTVRNAQHLGRALANHGFTVCAADYGFTRSHQLWIDIAPILFPTEANRLLLEAGIVVNAVEVPYLAAGTGLRLGVQELTRLGMGESEMDRLAQIFARILIHKDEPLLVANTVQELLSEYPPSFNPEDFDQILHLIQGKL